MRQQQLMVLSALASILAGCPNGGDVALEDVPEVLAPAYCDLLDRCGNPFVAQFLGGGGDCATGIIPTLEDSFVGRAEGAIASGTVVYHGELVDACVSALEGTGCGVEALEDGCSDVFEGTVALGGDCGWTEECVDGYCSMTDGTCPGTCAARVSAGAACTDGAACPAGFTCNEGNCVALATEGQACGGPNVGCSGIDLNCVGDGPEGGICQRWSDILSGAVGEPCSLATGDYCDPDLACVFDSVVGGMATFVCAERVARGAACAVGFPNPCPDDQFCSVVEGAMGTCTDLPVAGEDCTGTCRGNLRCVSYEDESRTCVDPRRLGNACTVDEECVSNTCSDGVCANPGC
jgi:hypothetical protein